MKVSFIIPAHNESAVIRDCLGSVVREIDRTGLDAEIIVADNCSSDGTGRIASSFPKVRVIEAKQKGANRARQAGLEASSGEFIANVDADTILPEGWLSVALSEFEKDPRLVALSGPFIYYDISPFARSLVKMFYAAGYLGHLLHQFVFRIGAMLQGGNIFMRRDALVRAGGYDTSIAFYGDDTHLARELSKLGHVKWKFGFTILASGRRLAHEGLMRSGFVYALNHFWVLYVGKPYTTAYKDIRPQVRL